MKLSPAGNAQGTVVPSTRGIARYRLAIKTEIIDKLVPHFINHPLEGNKLLQYNAWIKIVEILIKFPKFLAALRAARSCGMGPLRGPQPQRSQERDNAINDLIRDLSNL